MMRKTWVLAGAAVLAAVAITGGAVAVASGGDGATATAQEPPANTATVQRGTLSDTVSVNGTLTYRARPDGSPYTVINQARGTFTALPDDGEKIDCGGVLYRVDDRPVLLLCGAVPTYRGLHRGDAGNDVRQLNANLHALGYDADPGDDHFTSRTQQALDELGHVTGVSVTGGLGIDDAVVLPAAVRIAGVSGQLGGSAQPGAPVAQATSDTLEVQVGIEPAQQGAVQVGDRARITLPGTTSATGTVARLGRVATVPAGQDAGGGTATLPAAITLDDPGPASGLDKAPVRVDITTAGVENVLNVPVTALVGKAGGGFAVEVVRADGRRDLVAVKLGLFDTTGGRVQVDGDLQAGDPVVVPSL